MPQTSSYRGEGFLQNNLLRKRTDQRGRRGRRGVRVQMIVNNGNRTEWSPIRSVIKSD